MSSFDPPALSHLNIDNVENIYKVGAVVGIGTYGEVRCAVSLSTGERCAMKIVDLARFNEDTAELMRKEIKILNMMQHKHCIRLKHVHHSIAYTGTWCDNCACTSFASSSSCVPPLSAHSYASIANQQDDELCTLCNHSKYEHSQVETRNVMLIIQELAVAGELFNLISYSGKLSEDIARVYFRQLIEGLEYLHQLGIAHRDLKPENLVLNEDFQLKIVDFGLASVGSPSPSGPPVHHSGVGSQPYSSPECYYVSSLYAGKPYRGAPADIWSCAVILYVMITGKPPFHRPLAKTYGAHLRRCKFFVELMNGGGLDGVSSEARDLLLRLFKVDPSLRPSIADIKSHPWYCLPVPDPAIVQATIEGIVYPHLLANGQNGKEIYTLLSKIRAGGEIPTPTTPRKSELFIPPPAHPTMSQFTPERYDQPTHAHPIYHMERDCVSNTCSTAPSPCFLSQSPMSQASPIPLPLSPSLAPSPIVSPCLSSTPPHLHVPELPPRIVHESHEHEVKTPASPRRRMSTDKKPSPPRSPPRVIDGTPTPTPTQPLTSSSPPFIHCRSSLGRKEIIDMLSLKLAARNFHLSSSPPTLPLPSHAQAMTVVGLHSSQPLTVAITITSLSPLKGHACNFQRISGDHTAFEDFVTKMTNGIKDY